MRKADLWNWGAKIALRSESDTQCKKSKVGTPNFDSLFVLAPFLRILGRAAFSLVLPGVSGHWSFNCCCFFHCDTCVGASSIDLWFICPLIQATVGDWTCSVRLKSPSRIELSSRANVTALTLNVPGEAKLWWSLFSRIDRKPAESNKTVPIYRLDESAIRRGICFFSTVGFESQSQFWDISVRAALLRLSLYVWNYNFHSTVGQRSLLL